MKNSKKSKKEIPTISKADQDMIDELDYEYKRLTNHTISGKDTGMKHNETLYIS